MKAIQVHEFGGSEVMKLEEIPDPHPGPGQVVVKLKAVGVNPVDVYIRSGEYGKGRLPYVPGFDAAGVVEEVGDGVTRVQVDDRVYLAGTLTGAYAEKALCEENQVHIIPNRVSYKQGAALGIPYTAAYRALFQRAGAKAGETVLIHGATGGVGMATLQWARAAGMTVIATGGSDQGLALASAQGAQHVLNHFDPDYLERIPELTDGRGVNVIVELAANVNLGNDLRFLAKGGRVSIVGGRGKVEIDPGDAVMRDATIFAMSLFNASAEELAGIHAAIGAGLVCGSIRPVVSMEMLLEEAPSAHESIMSPGALGKIVLIPLKDRL
jgi:NADPH:quinone reductase